MGSRTTNDGQGLSKIRSTQKVREHEVLRIAASLAFGAGTERMEKARREVLTWAQRRSGGALPETAWSGNSFEYLAGGRTTMGVRLRTGTTDIWAFRADDPDKEIPGRTWTTEVTLGQAHKTGPLLSLRLTASTSEDEFQIEPHPPGLLHQISRKCGLAVGAYKIESKPWVIASEDDIEKLINMLEDSRRVLPIFIASGDVRSKNPNSPLINTGLLASATVGLAHVVVLPGEYTYSLSDKFGKMRSVFHGAVRVFMPGFSASANPYEHRLFLADQICSAHGSLQCVHLLRLLAANHSLFRTRLDHDVMTFSAVRTYSLKIEQERGINDGSSYLKQLESAQRRIRSLEDELKEAKDWEQQLSDFHKAAEDRAKSVEAHLRGATIRIQNLTECLEKYGNREDDDVTMPTSWGDFADWCDKNLVGRLVLAPAARRGVSKPDFTDVSLAARCLLWLADECRKRRMEGGGKISESVVEEGVRNSSCGGDSYEFEFCGQRLVADWHVKCGGNTRDPSRCLRIYYAWDQQSMQIVISDMPGHRRTGAS
ncbi:hypothetical protein dsx2_2396 [Desulfovibrio sp. X2]|uniref:hypothetical protein n=1 Tax=Desulfovibrio sp. X2 TaxID=941449 RepID=UPI000358B003|nr:hypothetical protein [Desulfovibrio sp. X2]EPR43352.1 hypothetical protein dsx2_2396 [Desulfovibrio sp. X2]